MHKKYQCLTLFFFLCTALINAQQPVLRSVQAVSSEIGSRLFWDPLSGTVVMEKGGHYVNFRSGESLVFFDYTTTALMDPPQQSTRGIFITDQFAQKLKDFFVTLPPPVAYRVGTILIDPGHGGKDPGAIGKTTVNGKSVEVREKDVVLKTALALHSMLTKAYPDKNIVLTRSEDSFPSLQDRVEMANSAETKEHEAILYISIHANAAFNTASKGFEVWYLSPEYRRTVIEKTDTGNADILPILNSMLEEEFTTESILIAKSILDGLDTQIGSTTKNRGIKEESWFVVRNAKMPSVLVELGFVTNPEEARLLADESYLKKIAVGMYNGLSTFITHFEGSRGINGQQ